MIAPTVAPARLAEAWAALERWQERLDANNQRRSA